MRQAGRYMASFREYSTTIGFRERSETPDIATELSLLRSEVNSELNFPPNFEGLVLGCIDADFCK